MKGIKDKWWLDEIQNKKEFTIETYFGSLAEKTFFIIIKSKDGKTRGVIALKREHRPLMKNMRKILISITETYKELKAKLKKRRKNESQINN